MRNRRIVFTAAVLLSAPLAVHLSAQWLNYPTPGIPRLPDGKPNLSAPAPKTADGKPDLSGIWLVNGLDAKNIAPNGVEPPLQPWAETLYRQRLLTSGRDRPGTRCLPPGLPLADLVPDGPFKLIQTPGMLVILYETFTTYRQVFTDGRALPKDPNPAWMGYSVGKWEGDTLRIDTEGFNDETWLDADGHPHSESLHVVENFRRKDFGHMELQVVIDDPRAYTSAWTTSKWDFVLLPETELIEFVCNENEKDLKHMVGK